MKYLKLIFFTLVLMSFFILSKVNALEMTTQSLNNNVTGNDTFDSNVGYFFKNNVNFQNVWTERFTFTNPIDIQGYDYAQFGFVLNYSLITTSDGYIINDTDAEYYCTNWVQQYQAYADGTTSSYWLCSTWDLRGSGGDDVSEHITISSTETPYIGINIDLVFQNGVVSPCEVNSVNMGNTYITCKIPNTARTITNIRFRNAGSLRPTTGRFGLQNVITKWKDPTSILSSNQQDTTNAINDVNNSINNNNVSGANNDANSFVNNQAFQDNTGLSSVITAPLSVVNSLTSTCSPIRLTLPYIDTDIDIPCIGTMLEQKVGALAQLIKVVINGFICYIIGVDLFRIVKNARNPEDDRIEVLDL